MKLCSHSNTLLLKVCHKKKQENQATIYKRFSVDADNMALTYLSALSLLWLTDVDVAGAVCVRFHGSEAEAEAG